MTTREDRIAQTFVELADTLVADFDVIDFLHTLADRSVELLDADAAGIMLGDQRGGLHQVASSTEEARLIELFEHQNNEGPCLDCFRSGQPVQRASIPEMRASWPAFTTRLEQLGFQAAQAIPLRLRTEVIGALNLFRTSPGVLSESDSRMAQALADVATVGLLQQRAVTERDMLAEQLQTALNSRIVLEQAKGMIAERTGLQMGAAFQVLRDYARKHGEKLSDVAVRVIEGSFAEVLRSAPKTEQTRPAT